jgi:AraC-like DNA-binding protein
MPQPIATISRWSRFDSREAAGNWRSALEEKIINVDVTPLDDAPVRAAIAMADLGELSVVAFDMSPVAMARTRRHVADGYDGFALSVATVASLVARQAGDEFALAPGEAVLMDARAPSDLAGRDGAAFLGFRISRGWFDRFDLRSPEGAWKVRASMPLGLLCAYARRMAAAQEQERAGLARMFESHVGELLAASLIAGGAVAGGDAAALGDARYRCIVEALRARSGEPDLTLLAFARAIGLSERSVQAALQRHGATFSDLLRRYRLASAHAALTRGEGGVASVAFAAGFQDLTTFNRAFKAAYAMTPRDAMTAAATRGGRPFDRP